MAQVIASLGSLLAINGSAGGFGITNLASIGGASGSMAFTGAMTFATSGSTINSGVNGDWYIRGGTVQIGGDVNTNVGFYGTAGAHQHAAIADGTDPRLNDLLSAMRLLGLIAT